jgi:hypothetical protein
MYVLAKGYVIDQCLSWDSSRADTVQLRLLRTILEANQNTAYGIDHNFPALVQLNDSDIVAAYQAKQSPTTYADIAPYIARIQKGEARVLTHSPVVHLGLTRGKHLLPVTQNSLAIAELYGPPLMYKALFTARPTTFISLQRSLFFRLRFPPTSTDALRILPGVEALMSGSGSHAAPQFLSVVPFRFFDGVFSHAQSLYLQQLHALYDSKLGSIHSLFLEDSIAFLDTLEQHWSHLSDDLKIGEVLDVVQPELLSDGMRAPSASEAQKLMQDLAPIKDEARAIEVERIFQPEQSKNRVRLLWPWLTVFIGASPQFAQDSQTIAR